MTWLLVLNKKREGPSKLPGPFKLAAVNRGWLINPRGKLFSLVSDDVQVSVVL
jgi:hypothetical protein